MKVISVRENSDPENPGTGEVEVTCPLCNGEGEIEWGRMEEIPQE